MSEAGMVESFMCMIEAMSSVGYIAEDDVNSIAEEIEAFGSDISYSDLRGVMLSSIGQIEPSNILQIENVDFSKADHALSAFSSFEENYNPALMNHLDKIGMEPTPAVCTTSRMAAPSV